jgi:hypothetical protein
MPKMKSENSYNYIQGTVWLATMKKIRESDERSVVKGK